MHRTPTQVQREEQVDLFAVVTEMLGGGKALTEIAHQYNMKVTSLANFLYNERNKRLRTQQVDASEYRIPGKRGYVERVARERYGKNLLDLLMDWIKEPNTTVPDMALRLGCSRKHLAAYLRKHGLNMTIAEGRARARRAGKINYDSIIGKIRAGAVKRVVHGSFAAQHLAQQIKLGLSRRSRVDWHFVIGQNEWCIISPFEIDIPIVAIAAGSTAAWKQCRVFAVEVDGEKYHRDRPQDREKERLLSERGWPLYRVRLPASAPEDYIAAQAEATVEHILGQLRTDNERTITL